MLRACLLWLGLTIAAFAHDPGLSTATVQLRPDGCDLSLVLSTKDAALLTMGVVTERKLQSIAPALIEITTDSERRAPEKFRCHIDEQANATIEAEVRGVFTNLSFRSACFAQLPPGHRQFLTVRGVNGEVLVEKLLSVSADGTTVPVARSVANQEPHANSVGAFVLLGVKHILTGYDHLLFLFSLLIVIRSFGATAKIITCFTIAHSITLALAALRIVEIQSRIVEPIIALSIIYVAVENLLRADAPKYRGVLTFLFGLVHGLGFASALCELGLGSSFRDVAMPLIGFNAGVELGQLLVAAVVLPLIWSVNSKSRFATRWVPACSIAVAILGGYWFVQRLLG